MGPICHAPWTSLKLDPMGMVKICRYAEGYDLGVIRPGGPSLRSIWEGRPATALREAIEAGDLSHGCSACVPAAVGGPVLAREYDHFELAGGDWPQTMDLSLSSTCNLACITCNGHLSSRIRREREHLPRIPSPYDDAFFEQLAEFIPHVRDFTFHGGEPFLGRATKRVWKMIREAGTHPKVVVSTNGTIFNDEVEELVRALRMRTTISIDGFTAATNEHIRTGVVHEEQLRNIERFAAVAADIGQTLRFNYCLVRENAHELADFMVWSSELGIETRVIPVTEPPRFDVGLLPPDERRRVMAAMRADGDRVGDRMGMNRAAFDEAVRQIDDERPPAATEIVVRVRPTADPPAPPPLEPVPVTYHLAPIPADALEVDIDAEGRIRSIHLPTWVRSLDTAAWIGQPAFEAPAFLAAHYGALPLLRLVADPDGTRAIELAFATGSGTVVLASMPEVSGPPGAPMTFRVQFVEDTRTDAPDLA